MTDQVTPEGGALPSVSGANATFAQAEAEAADAAAKAKKEGEAASPPAAPDPGEKKVEPTKDGRDLRISELTRRLRQAERDRERLLRLAEERGQPQANPPQQPAQQTRKTLKDFNFDDGAYAEHLRNEARSEAAEAARQEALRLREHEVTTLRREKFDERVSAFATAHPDYTAVVEGEWSCSKPMAEAIEDSDEGPALAYYLAQNPEIARAMSRLSPVQAGRELAKLEVQLVTERKKAAEKPVSQAPPPPPKIEGGDPGNVEKDPSKMTDAQFRKWREGFQARR